MIGAVSNQANVYDLIATRRQPAATSTDSATSTDQTSRRHRSGPPGPPPEALDAAADVLGMTQTELTGALQSGSTLKDIAASKGVSESDLLTAVSNGLKAGMANRSAAGNNAARPELSDDRLTEIATHIINGDQPTFPTGATSAGKSNDLTALVLRALDISSQESGDVGSSQTSTSARSAYKACTAPSDAADLSSSLQLDVTSLIEQLKSGTHLSDIAAQSGTSADDLTSSLLVGMLTDTKA